MSRILLVSDIHSNLAALDAVLRDADTRGPIDRVWSLGDAVGYGPQPNECLSRLQSLRALAVVGNHELAALGSIPVDDFNEHAKAAALWTGRELSVESRKYVESMPRKAVDGDFTLVHGSPRDPVWEYLFNAGVAAVNMPYLETRHCVNGHTHVPIILPTTGNEAETIEPEHGQVVELSSRRAFINPGSVGQPRDRDPRASYALLDDEMNSVSYFRIEYPIGETQSLMQQAGLPEILWRRLGLGY